MFARAAFRAAQPLKRVSLHARACELCRPACFPSLPVLTAETQNLISRSYATEPAKGGSNVLLYAAGAAAVGGAGYYFTATPSGKRTAEKAEGEVAKVAGTPKPAFTGGDQGFLSLVLEEVEDVTHNTKRFRFKLPEADMVSGMHVASALLTKYKYEDMEKPVIRPYTPTSDEGMYTRCYHAHNRRHAG